MLRLVSVPFAVVLLLQTTAALRKFKEESFEQTKLVEIAVQQINSGEKEKVEDSGNGGDYQDCEDAALKNYEERIKWCEK